MMDIKFLYPICRRHILLFVSVILFLTSCISTKRYASFTKEKLSEITPSQAALPDHLEIKTDSLKIQDGLIKVEKLKSFFIPAILYWQSEHTLQCNLNPKVPAKIFEQEIIRLADSLDLKSKLNGQKLELSLLQIPHSFVYTHKETAIILIVAYAISALEAIYPDSRELKVSYRVLENGEIKKTGIITVPNVEQPIKNLWKSTKKFTWVYLDQYRQNSNKMSREFFKQLVEIL